MSASEHRRVPERHATRRSTATVLATAVTAAIIAGCGAGDTESRLASSTSDARTPSQAPDGTLAAVDAKALPRVSAAICRAFGSRPNRMAVDPSIIEQCVLAGYTPAPGPAPGPAPTPSPPPAAALNPVPLGVKRVQEQFCRLGADRWAQLTRTSYGRSIKIRTLIDDCTVVSPDVLPTPVQP